MRLMRNIVGILVVMTLLTSTAVSMAQADCPGAPLPRLTIGGQGVVTPGSANNVRETPTTSGVLLGQLPAGARFSVIDGPTCADGYNWWQISGNGLTGWTVEGQGADYYLEPGADLEFQGYRPLDRHIRFGYDASFAESVRSSHYPVAVSDADMIGSTPEYTLLAFERYDRQANRWVDNGTVIYVYDLSTVTPDMNLNGSVNSLQAALAQRPDSPSIRPMVPYPAPTVFTARETYHDLNSMSGVSYLTASRFDVAPITLSDVRYLFQGLTDDGRYAVAMVSTIQTSLIPTSGPAELDLAAFEANFESYVADMVSRLEAASEDEIVPLSSFDTILSTLTIEPPEGNFTSQDGETIEVSYENISFSVDASLAYRVQLDVIPGFLDPDGMSMFGSMPDVIEFTLVGYPVRQLYAQPQIFFFPIDTFIMDSVYGGRLQELQARLAGEPPIASGRPGSEPGVEEIPFLPVYNAAQVMIARPDYYAFMGGVGLSFLTYYAQDISVATNESVFRAFIGLTSDGSYAVSATFPIRTDVLPDTFDYMSVNYDTFPEESADIVRQQVEDLNNEDYGNFEPDQFAVGALIESIRFR